MLPDRETILRLLVEDDLMVAAANRPPAPAPVPAEPYNLKEEFSPATGSTTTTSRRFTVPNEGLLESIAVRATSADPGDTVEVRGRGFRLNIQAVPVSTGTNTFDYSQNPIKVQPNNVIEVIFVSGGTAKTVTIVLYLRR